MKILIAVFFSFSHLLLAQEPDTGKEIYISSADTGSYQATLIKMMLTLAGLLILVLGTLWALKKFTQGRLGGFGSQKKIVILEKKPLSPKTLLYLVEWEGKKVLLSESQLEVRALSQSHESDGYP